MDIKELDTKDLGDIRGSLESIKNLAATGMLLIDMSKTELLPTILEDLLEHSQRLTLEYSTVEESL